LTARGKEKKIRGKGTQPYRRGKGKGRGEKRPSQAVKEKEGAPVPKWTEDRKRDRPEVTKKKEKKKEEKNFRAPEKKQGKTQYTSIEREDQFCKKKERKKKNPAEKRGGEKKRPREARRKSVTAKKGRRGGLERHKKIRRSLPRRTNAQDQADALDQEGGKKGGRRDLPPYRKEENDKAPAVAKRGEEGTAVGFGRRKGKKKKKKKT